MKNLHRREQSLRLLLAILLIPAIILIYGCGTKENKNLLEARKAIADKKYQAAKSAVQIVLSENSDNVEAKCLKELLSVKDKKDANAWSKSLEKVLDYLKPLNAEIERLDAIPDPTSDDLDQLEFQIRQRNSSMGFAALALADVNAKDNVLLNELVKSSGSTVVKALLEATKSYDANVRETVTRLVMSVGDSMLQPLTNELINPDTAIRRQAVSLLGKLKNPEAIGSISELISNKTEDSEVLYNVAIALETIGGTGIVEPLKLLLKTNGSQARMHAAKLLGMMRVNSAVPELLPLLADDNSYVKNTAMMALTNIGEPAVPDLIEVLNKSAKNILPDKKEDMSLGFLANVYINEDRLTARRNSTQTAVMTVLADMKAKSAIPDLIGKLDDEELQSGAAAALTTMGGEAVPALIDLLDSSDKDLRIQASSILSSIGDLRAVTPLISSLKNDSAKDVRSNAATALGNMKARGENNQAVETLTDALDVDEKTMVSAIVALSAIKVKNDRAIEKLIEIASDRYERESIRTKAFTALQSLAPKTATGAMLRIMMTDGESAVVRKAAVTVLGEIKDEKSKPALLWVNSILHEEIDDFQRELKRRYKIIGDLEAAIKKLNIPWNAEYPEAEYNSWREIKPIPSLVRSEVARALGKIKGDDVVDPLIESLKEDERAAVRQGAAWALGEIKGDKVIDPLIRVLKKDDRGNVRSECAAALNKIGGQKIIKPLLKTLNDDEYEAARKNAAIGLREEKYDFAAEGLADVLKKGIGQYEEDQEVESILNEVYTALRLDGTVAVKPMIDAYNSSDRSDVRKYAIRALGIIADAQALDTMLTAMKEDESVIVRERAAALLGNLKKRKVVEPLLAVVKDENEWRAVRQGAINSLGNLKDERAIEPLLELLDSDDDAIQNSAINAFGKFKDTRAVEKLIDIVKDPFELTTVKGSAIAALGNIGDKSAEDVLLKVLNTELGMAKIKLTTRIKTIRENAVVALGKLESQKAVPRLIEILEDKGQNETIRKNAATALAAIGDERAVPVISRTLVDETEYKISIDVDVIRRNYFWETVVNAARTFDTEGYVAPKLIERMDDDWEQYKIQAFAALSLGKTGTPEAIERLKKDISDSTGMRRQYAIKSLAETERKEFSELLVQIMKGSDEPKDDRRHATQGLGAIADSSTTTDLIAIMQDTSVHEEIRRDAAIALGKIGNEAAVSALIDELSKSDSTKNLKMDILTGLKTAASDQAVESVSSILEDEDADLHYRAASVLNEIQGEVDGYKFAG